MSFREKLRERARGVGEFLSRHWKSASAGFLATSITAAAVLALVLFPAALPAVIGFSLFGIAPFAALASIPVAFAIAAIGVGVFAANLGLSALFNGVVKIYDSMDKRFNPKKPDDATPGTDDNVPDAPGAFNGLGGSSEQPRDEQNSEAVRVGQNAPAAVSTPQDVDSYTTTGVRL